MIDDELPIDRFPVIACCLAAIGGVIFWCLLVGGIAWLILVR